MRELTSEEEACLKELVDVYELDESTSEFVSNRLFGELKEGTREFNRQKRIYESLADKGFTVADSYYHFGADADTELTSKGRCYFKDAEKQRKIERRRMWGNMAFQVLLSFATLAISALLSYSVSMKVNSDTENQGKAISVDAYQQGYQAGNQHASADHNGQVEQEKLEFVHPENLADDPMDGVQE